MLMKLIFLISCSNLAVEDVEIIKLNNRQTGYALSSENINKLSFRSRFIGKKSVTLVLSLTNRFLASLRNDTEFNFVRFSE